MSADLIVHNISQLITPNGSSFIRGEKMKNLKVIKNAFVVIENGKFTKIGSGDDYKKHIMANTKLVDGSKYLVTPGLIDSHTHLVHGGSRENELDMKLKGVPYLEILASGGGILSTVESTKNASFTELYEKAKNSLDTMLKYGVTSIEAKSGYGLDLETEIKQLEVNKKLNEDHPVDIKSTFLGAHAIPKKYKDKKDAYIKEVIKMLPIIKEKQLADYCDIFCEDEVFSLNESEEILSEAKKNGFKLKMHADEIVPLGGASLACSLGCVSADHLIQSRNEDIEKLASSDIVSNLLPATSFNLGKNYAKARLMIDLGCCVALSSDYNPGSCPSENLQFVMQLASMKLRMLPNEVLTAVTLNSACCINEEKDKGSIEVGKCADFVLFDVPNIEYLIYHFGINHVKDVYKNGKLVVSNQQICY